MIEIKETKPTLEEFKELRDNADWNIKDKGISDERAEKSLQASPYCVCAYNDNKIIGMVRITGDLEMYGYIQDTIVHSDYRGHGIGTKLMSTLLQKVHYLEGYLLGVCPSKSSVEFYSKFGFIKRPEQPNGFMYLVVKSNA